MSKALKLVIALIAGALSVCSVQPVAASTTSPVHESFVETARGVRIHILEAGTASSKPALILIPGWRLTASLWRQQIEGFSRDRKVIALDPRSEGDSTITGEGNTPEDRARDLKAVIKARLAGPVVIIAWSQAVQDVAAFVTQFGTDNVTALVLVDAPVSSGIARIKRDPDYAAQLLQYVADYVRDPQAITEGMARSIVQRPLPASEFQQLVTNALKTPSAIGASMLINDLLGPDRTPALARMTVPTLVIAAANSRELDDQRAEAAKLPRGRFEVITGTGHAVFIDQPDRFQASVQSFLSSLDNSADGGAPVGAGRKTGERAEAAAERGVAVEADRDGNVAY